MNKQQLFEFLDKNLENDTLEEKVSFIKRKLPNWLSEYSDALVSDRYYCFGCKKYIPVADFTFYEKTSLETDYCHSEPVKVKRRAIYSKCPCGKVVMEKILSSELVRWL